VGVWVCTHTCILIHTYMHAYIRITYIHAYTHTYVYVRTYTHRNIYIWTSGRRQPSHRHLAKRPIIKTKETFYIHTYMDRWTQTTKSPTPGKSPPPSGQKVSFVLIIGLFCVDIRSLMANPLLPLLQTPHSRLPACRR
jgi:hypothetical protein